MQHLLALYGEQSGEDALGQTSAEHDNLDCCVSEQLADMVQIRTSYSSSMVVH